MAELDNAQVTNLMTRLDQGLHETAAGFTRGTMWVGALFFVIAVSFAVQGAWGAAAFGGVFGGAIVALGVVAARKNTPEKMRPVVEAVRDAPERVVSLRHYQTSDTRRVFVTDWLEIRTAEHRMIFKAKKDWQDVLDLLKQRCPTAKVLGDS